MYVWAIGNRYEPLLLLLETRWHMSIYLYEHVNQVTCIHFFSLPIAKKLLEILEIHLKMSRLCCREQFSRI